MAHEDNFIVISPIFKTTGKLLLSVLFYPIVNVKTLIQLGHEPFTPYPTKTLFGKHVYRLPNVFNYVKHIYQVDGVEGCYRGFLPWVSTKILYRFTLVRVNKSLPAVPFEGSYEKYLTKEEKFVVFSEVTLREMACRSLAIIVTQPFHVLTLRTIAQFIGNEDKYDGIFSGLWTILKEEGVVGLFSGLVPRLLGEVFQFATASMAVFLIHQFVIENPHTKKCVSDVIQHLASNSFYSFRLVSSCMAVSDCGLAAGSPPHMPHYPNMLVCWNHLQSIHQLRRGSVNNVLWRYYTPVSPQLLSPHKH